MKRFLILILISLMLGSCSGMVTSERQLANILSSLHEKEKQGMFYTKKIRQMEVKEQRLFAKTMLLTQQQYSEVSKRTAALKKSARERIVLAEKEEAMFQEAEEQAEQLYEMSAANYTDDSATEKIVRAVKERYAIQRKLITDYKQLTELQIQLYMQLENKEVREADLQKQTQEVNLQLHEVEEQIANFNEATAEANRLIIRTLKSLEKEK